MKKTVKDLFGTYHGVEWDVDLGYSEVFNRTLRYDVAILGGHLDQGVFYNKNKVKLSLHFRENGLKLSAGYSRVKIKPATKTQKTEDPTNPYVLKETSDLNELAFIYDDFFTEAKAHPAETQELVGNGYPGREESPEPEVVVFHEDSEADTSQKVNF